jgi:hypothetical protein
MQLFAQDYLVNSINVNLPTFPDANTANWANAASSLMITATTSPENLKLVMESKILVIIKKGGSKVCGTYTSSTAPASNFNTINKVWSGKAATSLLGQDYILSPGDYELCVQLFSLRNSAISEERCKSFTIRGEEKTDYQAPQAISPADGTVINEADAKKPVIFRWSPVVPKPKGDVIYKLNIFEIKEGQAVTAIKGQRPIYEKDVVDLQSVLPSLSQLPIGKGSSYCWFVQAVNKEGKSYGGNNGTSNVNTFSLKSSNIFITDFKINCGNTPGSYLFSLSAQNNGDHNFLLTGITLNPSSTITTLTLSTLPATIVAGGNLSFSGTFNYTGVLPNMVVASINGHQDGNIYLTSSDTEIDTVKACLCSDCDNLNWSFNLSATKVNNNKYNLTGSLGVNLPIYGVEFQVHSYTYSSPEACSNGVTSLEESGVFLIPATTINNSTAFQMLNENISGSLSTNNNASKTVKLLSSSILPNPIPVRFTIGLPGIIPGLPPGCCSIKYRVCIKATVYYDAEHCKSCTIIRCFEFNNQ